MSGRLGVDNPAQALERRSRLEESIKARHASPVRLTLVGEQGRFLHVVFGLARAEAIRSTPGAYCIDNGIEAVRSAPGEYYIVNADEDGQVVASLVVVVCRLADVGPLRANERSRLGGPYFHDPRRFVGPESEIAFVDSIVALPGSPSHVLFAFADAVASLGLPTYTFGSNERFFRLAEKRWRSFDYRTMSQEARSS